MTDDTRAKILRAALEEFSARGFHETSVRELAERVGVTKTAVLYHFPGKADIVTALAEPMLADFEAALAQAAEASDTRRAAVEGLLEVWLTHRYLLRMNLRDLGLTASEVVFERFRDGMLRANGLVAGPDADFADRVRAAQAIAMLSDPVVLFAEASQAELRAAILDGVDRLFTAAGGEGSGRGEPGASTIRTASAVDDSEPPEGRESGVAAERNSHLGAPAAAGITPAARKSRRGRPPAMKPEVIEAARRLYDAGRAPADIATALGVSRATIYRHLPVAD
ncbi:TetR family transcriptional regulator [Amycolatopsis mediterranei]|uniref:TetR family transcriptional regulator n=1 Tax=Amycolatopsis mediterranei TaxID=33910 RepID=UPI00049EC6AF|nr:TetR family transcriptional regulator [Amycolatopsis mediterranei]KDO06395.1 TetR family transcriptional regulator [Amycolatopsis mediterranei]UZF71514.1 TetR family transcriptional regulator [Amycolatopsis mediterranei]